MNRLQREVQRLYAVPTPGAADAAADEPCLIDADGRVRAMVLGLARPADWQALSKVWQGVQTDLALPAPAIAVSGTDGYQLWLSLAAPVPMPQAVAFLEALRQRYLSDIPAHRVALMPAADDPCARHAKPVPAAQADSGLWSAFVAPDLAPMFADEPWLDLPPSPEGQSDLLSRLTCIRPDDFQRAQAQLMPALPAAPVPGAVDSAALPAGTGRDPQRFLLDVMNDDRVALGLRIEAARALLPYLPPSGRT